MADGPIRLSYRDELALDAAKLYYAGLKQSEVATRLSISRSTVSKLLTHAHSRGFIHTEVRDPRELDEWLLDGLQRHFDLRNVRLVNPAEAACSSLRAALGAAGAELLAALLRDGDHLAVVPSRTIGEVARSISGQTRRGIHVVEASRGLSLARPVVSDSRTLTWLAAVLGAKLSSLKAPIFADSIPRKNALAKLPRIRTVLDLGAAARIALFTVGDIASNAIFVTEGTIPRPDKRVLLERACGDICSRFIDPYGRICLPDLNNRAIGITLPELRAKDQKLLVAGGVGKASVIHAALHNRYVNHLVIDVRTARAVLEIHDQS